MSQDSENNNNLRNRYLALLDQKCDEQIYQDFLEKNTQLIPREFLQNHGLHLDLVVRKMPLGSSYKTDFFYISKSSADWTLVLVEIEKPHSRYFKDRSTNLHRDFLNAIDQIDRWQAWFSEDVNKLAFIKTHLDPVRVNRAMRDNPCDVKYVLVHGRRSEFEGSALKTSLIKIKEKDNFKILSFDSLAESLHTKQDLYIAAKKGEYFDILSERFINENILVWTDPSYIRMTSALKADFISKLDTCYSRTSVSGEALSDVLNRVSING